MCSKREGKVSLLLGVLIDAGIARELGRSWRKVIKTASHRYIGRDAKFLNTTIKMNDESFENIINLMVDGY